MACAPFGRIGPGWHCGVPLCLDGSLVSCLQMDQIINVVGEVYSMQLEVDAAIRAITVRQTSGVS